ncbi:hypothetical protein AAEP93_010491 [Penicillium crustosum]
MRSRSGSMNRSVESDQEHNQQSTDHSVVTRRGAPARHSRRERSEEQPGRRVDLSRDIDTCDII